MFQVSTVLVTFSYAIDSISDITFHSYITLISYRVHKKHAYKKAIWTELGGHDSLLFLQKENETWKQNRKDPLSISFKSDFFIWE